MPRLTPLDFKPGRLRHSLRSTNKFIAHLNRLLSSTCHLDSLLGVVYYTLSLLLMRGFRRPKKEQLRGINISRLLDLINTMRTFLRLSTGLVGIISSSSSLLLSPQGNNSNDKSKQHMKKTPNQGRGEVMMITRARRGAEIVQLALLSVYQLYENIGFLTDQGILLLPSSSSSSSSSSRGTDDDKINNIADAVKNHYLTSSRAWMGSVVFSIFSTLLATSDKKQQQGEESLWWSRWMNLAVPVGINLPLSAHASFEKGLLADEAVALMGLVVAGLGLRKGWVDTDEEEEEEEGKRKRKEKGEKGRGAEEEDDDDEKERKGKEE